MARPMLNHTPAVANRRKVEDRRSCKDLTEGSDNDSNFEPENGDGNHYPVNSDYCSDDLERELNSGVIMIQKLFSLFKVTLNASSKIVSPPLVLLVTSARKIIKELYEELTPVRVKDWSQIFGSVCNNLWTIVVHNQSGKTVRKNANNVCSEIGDIVTSCNSRQLVVDLAGTFIKGIDALRTPEAKDFIQNIPTLTIRILDTLSSGQAKALYHDLADLCWSTIELLGDEETIEAIAEVVGCVVHILDMEREIHAPLKRERIVRLRRKRQKVRLVAINKTRIKNRSRRRYDRNRFVSKTYSDRVILSDGYKTPCDHGKDNCVIEDAIVSSLEDCTHLENSWKRLGSKGKTSSDDDLASLPSRVIVTNDSPNLLDEDDEADRQDNDTINKCDSIEDIKDELRGNDLSDESSIENRYSDRTKMLPLNIRKDFSYGPFGHEDLRENNIPDISHSFHNKYSGVEHSNMRNHSGGISSKNLVDQIDTTSSTKAYTENKNKIFEYTATKSKAICKTNKKSSMHYFQSTLEEVLDKKLKKSVNRCALEENTTNVPAIPKKETNYGVKRIKRRGRRLSYSKAAIASGAGTERAQDSQRGSINFNLSSRGRCKRSIGVEKENHLYGRSTMLHKVSLKKLTIQYLKTLSPQHILLLLLFFSFLCVWFAIGFYGIFVLAERNIFNKKIENNSNIIPLPQSEREIVIKVVYDSFSNSLISRNNEANRKVKEHIDMSNLENFGTLQESIISIVDNA